nr:hypothetical protein BaRGS_029909 [Batillaria attramentaria]
MAGVYLFSFLLCAWSVLPRARAQESDIAADPQRQYACGTKFTDAASSALLADVVLQGSVDDLRQASPLAPLLYKANVTVQKVYKDSARAVDSAQTVFVNSALPKEMDLKVLRQAKRVLCPGCASEPVIKRLRCKNCAVRPKMRRKMSPSDTKIVRLGKRLTLRCVARAVPKPSYTWYKDGPEAGRPP